MDDLSHLQPDVRSWLDLSDEERVFQMSRDLWIGYPQAVDVLERMDQLLKHPRINRMPNLLLIGKTNNGKTQILKRFQELHSASDNIGGEAISCPVLYVETPPAPDEKRLYMEILDALFAKYSMSDSPSKLFANVKDKFERVGVRMLIIDELNKMLAGSMAKQRLFLTVIRHISNQLQVPLVCAGTEDAVRAVQTDPQASNRLIPIILPRWNMDTDFRRLLASWEKVLPLRYSSGLSDKALAHEIWARSEGTIGETVSLLKASAKFAIRTQRERIDLDVLERCGYEAPSGRKKTHLEI